MEKKRKEMVLVISLFIIIIIIFCLIVALVLKHNKTEVEIGGQKVAIVKSGDGLYKDGYISDRYIYRGANPDNYVSFNNELWRIVSVDGNGNIQII